MFDYRDCSLGPKNLKIFLMVCEIIIQKSFDATKCNLYTNFAFKNLFYRRKYLPLCVNNQ